MRKWVQTATEISVVTLKGYITVWISNQSTILDVKKSVLEFEGVPIDQQVLYPLSLNWWMLGLTEKLGSRLEDSQNVKEVMNLTNSNRFRLFLSLNQN